MNAPHPIRKSQAPDLTQDRTPDTVIRQDLLESGVAMRGFAASSVVNRTHRIVRERARSLEERRSRLRSLWLPITLSTCFFAAVIFAVWTVFDQYELTADALPDSSQGMMAFMMWCLPLSLVVLTVVWLTRSNRKADGGSR